VVQAFQGQEFEDNTGLYNFRARHYDAELGRFTSADTVVADLDDPRTINRYAFTGGNPIQFVDPTGRSFLSSVGDWFVGAGEDIGAWVEENSAEIITVVIIVVVVVVIVAAVVLTGGTAGVALVASAAALGAAAGFATFGGIALAQGNTFADANFWIAAGTGALLGAVVGAAIPVAVAPASVFTGAATTALFTGGALTLSFSQAVAAGVVIGAAMGGLEAAIECTSGCGGVENLFLPVVKGMVIGGIIGGLTAGIAKGIPGKNKLAKGFRFLLEPSGREVLALKVAYQSVSKAGVRGFSGDRNLGFDAVKFIGFGALASVNGISGWLGEGRIVGTAEDDLGSEAKRGTALATL
jgi:RHS repeat-associated protein